MLHDAGSRGRRRSGRQVSMDAARLTRDQVQATVDYGAVTACSLSRGRITFAFRRPHSEAADVAADELEVGVRD